MEIATKLVRYKSTGSLVRINESDFSADLHEDPKPASAPAAKPEPEPAVPKSERAPARSRKAE